MRAFRSFCCCLLWPAAALAGERPDEFAKLMSLVPAEPLAVAYLRSPADIVGHPLLREIVKDVAPEAGSTIQAFAGVFDGPLAIAVTGHPLRPDLLGVIIAARVRADRDQFFNALDEKLISSLNRLDGLCGGPVAFRKAGDLASVTLPAPIPIQLTVAHRDGLVVASSNRAMLDEWLSPQADGTAKTTDRFIDSADFQRLVPDRNADIAALLYVNGRPIVPLLQALCPSLPDGIGLEDVQALGITATASGRSQSVTITACLADEPRGRLSQLRPSSGSLTASRLVPSDATFAIGGRYETAATWLEGAKRIVNLIDADIVEEFEEEKSEFRDDFGFDIQADFLANLTGEWLLAGNVDLSGLRRAMLALRVADASLLQSYLAALTRTFKLELDHSTHREVTIFKPRSTHFSAAYALLDQYWIIGRDPSDVSAMIDAWMDKKSVEDAPAYRSIAASLKDSSYFAYLNVAPLAKLAVANARGASNRFAVDEAVSARLERMADSDEAGMVLTVRPAKDRIQIALQARGYDAKTTMWDDVAAAFLMPTLIRSRELAKRTVSLSNVQVISIAALNYANNNKGRWPPSLAALAEGGHVSLDQLGNPYDGTAPRTIASSDAESYYVFRGYVKSKTPPHEVPVVAEREIRLDEGANFGFADGHTEFVREPRASELLAAMRGG